VPRNLYPETPIQTQTSITRTAVGTRSQEYVLLVDDDAVLLRVLAEALEPTFALLTATHPDEALALLRQEPEVAVIVADMGLPGMNGVELLKQARLIAPNLSGVMLTACNDAATAINAINEGNVCRFLTKPCSFSELKRAIHDALHAQRRLAYLIDAQIQTLHGATDILVKVIQIVAPDTHALAERLRQRMRELALEMLQTEIWDLEIAAMLAPLGHIAHLQFEPSKDPVEALMGHFPQAAAALLKKIPRLESVARAVGYISKNFDGSGLPVDGFCGVDIPMGARMLRVVRDLEAGISAGFSPAEALEQMRRMDGIYDPEILAAAIACFAVGEEMLRGMAQMVHYQELTEGSVLAGDIPTGAGVLLLTNGCRVTPHLLRSIQFMAHTGQIAQELPVRCKPLGAVEPELRN